MRRREADKQEPSVKGGNGECEQQTRGSGTQLGEEGRGN